MNYPQFKLEWNGRRIDYDHVFAYQCVDPILEYMKECAAVATGIGGNAIDYADHPSPAFTNVTTRVNDYQTGDIVVLKGLSGNPYGHIGILDHADASNVWLFEQNGATGGGTGTGNDKLSVWRSIPKSRVIAIYRLKAFITPPVAAPPAHQTVFLPSAAGPWHLYNYGSSYTPSDVRAVKALLRPDHFPPGLTYPIVAWTANNSAVVIDTQMFGRGVVWVKNTSAQIR